MTVVVFIDGLAEPKNPGTGTYAYVAYKDGKKIAEEGGFAGEDVTNNFAEYSALAKALSRMRDMGVDDKIIIRSDSKLVVGQMSLGWKAKGGGYLVKYREVRDLLKGFPSVSFEWIPREKNEEADLLSRIAYHRIRR